MPEPENLEGSWVRIRLPRGEWFYDPKRRLGPAGGFGEVFEGRNPAGQPVAVKRLKLTTGEAAHRELKIADDLAGKPFEHVLTILDSGEDSEAGGYYVVMPRAERSLSDELTVRGMLPVNEATNVLRQIADGLKEVENIVHRDLKPANILFHEGKWKIADFGIARFVEDATSVNTVRDFLSAPYAAPEQWIGDHATHATDVYALSCVAHVVFRGEPPFFGPSRPDYQRQHTSETPPSLTGLDPRMRAVFAAGLRKPQGGRPPIERIIAVLRECSASPVPTSGGVGALHAANAAEAERISAAAAAVERERRKVAERQALIRTGEMIFRDILKEFESVVRKNASEAGVHVSASTLNIGMGPAALVIELQGAVPPNVTLGNGMWDVVAIGLIRVTQKAPEWMHGATLWYMRSRQNSDFRWYEAAYKRHALSLGPIVGPFPIQDLGNDIYQHASLAHGPGMNVIELEYSPSAIDDENVESFIERWLERLAKAYNGRLRPF
ncbi:MAG TPA: serine/threonine-protein kinase [Candidatus Sulfotelmatobacter sp.]|nr:serine/threonine-protein kinase [Candidatus Sulfotelmatobacter sp.]